ncbi:unnamed protein product, partial [marine sediment metagenome]
YQYGKDKVSPHLIPDPGDFVTAKPTLSLCQVITQNRKMDTVN